MSGFSDFLFEAELVARSIGDYFSGAPLRLGVTGLSRSGKTVFLTALVNNLVAGARLPVLAGKKLNSNRLKKADADALVESSLRGANLWEEVKDRLSMSGTSLSGGQQQRLCIARTIAVNPEVILMDEPTSALDPIASAKIEDLIDELRANYAITIVTHNMQQAARVSEFTAFMYLGELIEFDSTSKMFTAPHDQRTQDYITGRFG